MGFSDARINALRNSLVGLGLGSASAGPADTKAATIGQLQGLKGTNQASIGDMNALCERDGSGHRRAAGGWDGRGPRAGGRRGRAVQRQRRVGGGVRGERDDCGRGDHELRARPDNTGDDAILRDPVVQLRQNYSGLVGLRVVEQRRFLEAVDYAPIAITGGERRPR
ncbi:MAG: hypothetical protein U0232_20800 [Thermomicrobiales bacterium]